MRKFFASLALLILFASSAFAAAIDHTFVEQNTQQSTTSATYVDVTGASIASGNFTAGKKYLISVTAQLVDSANTRAFLQVVHGSTAFAESEAAVGRSASAYYAYGFITVWTAVSGEGIKLQFHNDGTNSALVDQIAMLAINLSDDLTENTDWLFAERSIDDTLSTTFLDGASITFTPGTAGQDWLVMSYMQSDVASTTTTVHSRIDRSGEAVSSLPEASIGGSAFDRQNVYLLSRVFNLGAASNTFKEQAKSSGTTDIRLHSSIFALNLNKFRNHANVYTEAGLALSATNFATQLQTLGITPDVAGNVWIGSYWGFDRNDIARDAKFRVQVDNADQPAGQTTDNYLFDYGNQAAEEDPMPLITVPNLTAAAHTIDLDASANSTTGAPAGNQRTLWAVTMELPAATSVLKTQTIVVQ